MDFFQQNILTKYFQSNIPKPKTKTSARPEEGQDPMSVSQKTSLDQYATCLTRITISTKPEK